jgi:GWxTD domain-containing protein
MPEEGHAQISPAFEQPSAFVDFDQTLGMPPYVFRTYQFAVEQPVKATPVRVRLEVHIGMVNDILQFVKMAPDSSDEIRFQAQYEVNLMIYDDRKNAVDSRNWKRELLANSFDATNDRKKLNREFAFFELPPGEYEIALEITDRDTGKKLRDRRPLKVEPLGDDQLRVSSIVFTQRPPKDAGPGALAFAEIRDRAALRDSLPSNITSILMSLPPAVAENRAWDFTTDRSAAYFEIYGVTAGETLQLQYEILDWRRQVIHAWEETLAVSQTPVCHLAHLEGKLTSPGQHTLRVTAQRAGAGVSKHQREAKTEENFHVQISIDRNYTTQFLQNKNLLFAPLRYVARGAEYKRLAEADEVTRDSLITEFWRQRDPDPETETNALREEFYRRATFAEMRFAVSGIGKSGWETDRGRIYIIYGPPKEVHHQMAEQGSPPYEIWYYPDQDLYFVFRDKTGSGDFELVNRN